MSLHEASVDPRAVVDIHTNSPLKNVPYTVKDPISIESIDPKTLSEKDLQELCEVAEDMWAGSGIKEFVQCNDCHKIYSKKDIFGDLPETLYKNTVSRIMEITAQKNIICACCGGETEPLYGAKTYIDIMKEKYQQSVAAFLTIVRNEKGHIIGFSEGYVDTIDNLFARRDLGDHYGKVKISQVQKEINTILGYIPQKAFLISAIGLLEGYMNPFILINMLREFTKNIPTEYDRTPGIMELEKGHILHAVSETLGAQKSGISYPQDGGVNERGYGSDLLIFKDPIGSGKKNFSGGIIKFLRKRKQINTPLLQETIMNPVVHEPFREAA